MMIRRQGARCSAVPMKKNGARVRCRLLFCLSLSLSYACTHLMFMIAPHHICACVRTHVHDELEQRWSASW